MKWAPSLSRWEPPWSPWVARDQPQLLHLPTRLHGDTGPGPPLAHGPRAPAHGPRAPQKDSYVGEARPPPAPPQGADGDQVYNSTAGFHTVCSHRESGITGPRAPFGTRAPGPHTVQPLHPVPRIYHQGVHTGFQREVRVYLIN